MSTISDDLKFRIQTMMIVCEDKECPGNREDPTLRPDLRDQYGRCIIYPCLKRREDNG